MNGIFRSVLAAYVSIYRATGGVIGGRFMGGRVAIVTHRGARSGRERTTPILYQEYGDRLVLVASNGGRPRNPGWYHNLSAHPEVSLELGRTRRRMRARVATGDERERLWSKTKRDLPFFATYERRTSRQIPVVVLEPD